MPDIPGPVQVRARQLVRGQSHQDQLTVEQAWHAATGTTPPDWMHLTDENIQLVARWIDMKTWAESRDYLRQHADHLLSGAIESKHSSLKERAGVKPGLSWGYACWLAVFGQA